MSMITDELGLSASTIFVKNFITDSSKHYHPVNENNCINFERNLVNFEFLIAAPKNYQKINNKNKYIIFIDRNNFERELPINCFQISYHKSFKMQDFLAWTNQVIKALLNTLKLSSFSFDLLDLLLQLEAEPSKRFRLEEFTIHAMSNERKESSIFSQSSSILIIAMIPKLNTLLYLNELYRPILDVVKEDCQVRASIYEYPHMQHDNISILYGIPN